MRTQPLVKRTVITPTEALTRLKDGNARFVTSRQRHRDLALQVRATRGGQHPFAVVLGCIDSRVPPELVFDQGIGDIFSIRVAGNIINADVLGSMEFACKLAGARLILVLGHTTCGAIMGACDDVQLGHLTSLLTRIRLAIDAVPTPAGQARTSENAVFVQQVAEKNVALALDAINWQSPVLRTMLQQGEIGIVGAMYDVETGVVTFYD